MVHHTCCFFGCKNQSKKVHGTGITFMPFPKPNRDYSKCMRWIAASQPEQNANDFLQKINRHTYMCSVHFIGGNGPTMAHLDPITILSFTSEHGNQTLHRIEAPVGWLVERLENNGCRFSKKRDGHVILQCEVRENFSYHMEILGSPVEQLYFTKKFPKVEQFKDVVRLLSHIDTLVICCGNPEPDFIQLFTKISNSAKGRYDEKTKCVYSIECRLVANSTRCVWCSQFRSSLRALDSRSKNKPEKPNFTNKQLEKRIKELEKKIEAEKMARLELQLRAKSLKNPAVLSPHQRSQLKAFIGAPNKPKPSTGTRSEPPNFHFDTLEEMADLCRLDKLQDNQKYFALCINLNQSEGYHYGNELTVTGLTIDFQHSLAHFPAAKLIDDELYSLVWEAIRLLEGRGFRILVISGDCRATATRKLFELCTPNVENDCHHSTKNFFAFDSSDRDVYFVSDACNLILAIRNGLASSGTNEQKYARILWKNGENIVWRTIFKTFQHDAPKNPRLLSKLTYNHVLLRSNCKTKVSYAAQILSGSMAAAIENYLGENSYPETVKFLRTFNRLFDLLNTRQCPEDVNQNLGPYRNVDDDRLKWLEVDFMEYLADWEEDVLNRDGDFKKEQRTKMMLSCGLIEGLKITALSTVKIIRFLLNQNAKFVLTSNLNQ